uniref:Uncharacterized protein n=1 Tax=Anguilla anguilla TaxID=7936 RepID=A0A0E9RZW0_ANGAN
MLDLLKKIVRGIKKPECLFGRVFCGQMKQKLNCLAIMITAMYRGKG